MDGLKGKALAVFSVENGYMVDTLALKSGGYIGDVVVALSHTKKQVAFR